ncbi:MAG: type I restriction enzyme HsdR N-terminal domain-containing protein, partial [Veillonella sp.]|nr:type I restriction enzyme HsdR N-terminal domain-containing protein [Veillonella sp.]
MENVECIFNSIKLHEHQQDEKCYFDPIRYFLVQKTPEEEVRQKTIIFLQKKLGIPIERIRVEEPMCHVKNGLRGRADIVVYRDDNQEEVLLVIECKASHIDVECNMVLDQAIRYRDVLDAEYIML